LAIENLKIATAKAQDLDLHTSVMAWLRLGQAYDMRKQRALARPAYLAAIRAEPENDGAKEARHYVDKAYVRDYTKEP